LVFKKEPEELRCEVTEMTSAFRTYQAQAAVIFPVLDILNGRSGPECAMSQNLSFKNEPLSKVGLSIDAYMRFLALGFDRFDLKDSYLVEARNQHFNIIARWSEIRKIQKDMHHHVIDKS
jgi:hypothetical protein